MSAPRIPSIQIRIAAYFRDHRSGHMRLFAETGDERHRRVAHRLERAALQVERLTDDNPRIVKLRVLQEPEPFDVLALSEPAATRVSWFWFDSPNGTLDALLDEVIELEIKSAADPQMLDEHLGEL